MRNIRISVAMATYNGEKYLAEQLESILSNIGFNDEVIVSDDGSTDNTLHVIKTFEEKDNRVKLFHGKGQGVKKNFENALKYCSGEYIFLCDQDDVWFDNKVETVLPILKKHDLVVHDNVVIGDDENDILESSFIEYKHSRSGVINNIVRNTYIGCCMAFSRRLMEKSMPIPDNIEMHDQWIGVINDYYFKNTYFLKSPLMYYRRHGNNVSSFKHHPIIKMLRNRIVFCYCLIGKIIGARKS